jgi:hypothetical protein
MVLAAFLGAGIIQSAYGPEYGDVSFLEDNPFNTERIDPLVGPVLFVLWDSMPIILMLEHLRNHIGKKAPPDGDSEANNSIFTFHFETALLYSAVFS